LPPGAAGAIFGANTPYIAAGWPGPYHGYSANIAGLPVEWLIMSAMSTNNLYEAINGPIAADIKQSQFNFRNPDIRNEGIENSVIDQWRIGIEKLLISCFAPIICLDRSSVDFNWDSRNINLHKAAQSLLFTGGNASLIETKNSPRTDEQLLLAVYVYLFLNQFQKNIQKIKEASGTKKFVIYSTKGSFTLHRLLFDIGWKILGYKDFDFFKTSNTLEIVQSFISQNVNRSVGEVHEDPSVTLVDSFRFINDKTYNDLLEKRRDMLGVWFNEPIDYQTSVQEIMGQLSDDESATKEELIEKIIRQSFENEQNGIECGSPFHVRWNKFRSKPCFCL